MFPEPALKQAKRHSIYNGDPGRDVLWSHVNVGEAVPGVVTPLTAAFWHHSHTRVPRLMYHELGVLRGTELHDPFTPRTMPVQFIHGRMAANVDYLRLMADRLPGTSGAALEEQMLGSVRPDAKVNTDKSRYLAVAVSFIRMMAGMRKRTRQLHDRTMARWRNYAAYLPRADFETAQTVFEWEITKGQEDVIGTHGLTALLSPVVWEPLARMVRRVGTEDDVLAMSAGLGGVEEADMMQSLWELAHHGGTLEPFLKRYGFMGPDSGELESKPWRLDPRSLHAAIRAFENDPVSPSEKQQAAAARMEQTKARILKQLNPFLRPLFRLTHWLCKTYLPLREVGKACMIAHSDIGRLAANRMGELLHQDGLLDAPEDVFYLLPDDFKVSLAELHELKDRVAARKQDRAIYQRLDIPDSYTGRDIPHFWNALEHHGNALPALEQITELSGLGVSRGTVEGTARVISTADDFEDFQAGEILVCKSTDPGWAPVFSIAAAMVVDIGGMLSHSAIIARELGVPAVVNTRKGTRQLQTGQKLRVNGDSGLVEILSGPVAPAEDTHAIKPDGPAFDPRNLVASPLPDLSKITGFGKGIVALPDAGDVFDYGGKAAALAHAIAAGLPVPSGFALSWSAVDNLDEARLTNILNQFEGPVAVRSSGIGEDGADASFAGQHDTILGVAGPAQILEAIRTVAQSRHADHVAHYRETMGEQEAAPRMAIVVQSLVPSQKAGVMFTHNPVDGAEQRVVEAAWGLGEVVVGSMVTPDHFVLDADSGKIIESRPGHKDIVMHRTADGETITSPVTDEAITPLCLNAEDCAQLNELAKACLAAFGTPQDLEWAFAGDALYLLQSRPITTLD